MKHLYSSSSKRFVAYVVSITLIPFSLSLGQIEIGPNVVKRGTTVEVHGPPGTTLQTIIDDIDDEAADKPYLVTLGPGTYDLGTGNLQIPSYISLKGAGRNQTTIVGSENGPDGLVQLQGDDISISDLTVINDDSNTVGAVFIAIKIGAGAINSRRFRIENVVAIAADASNSTTGIGTSSSIIDCGGGELVNVKTTASGASLSNTGASLSCSGDPIEAFNLEATGLGVGGRGLYKTFTGTLIVRNSSFTGDANSIDRNNGQLIVLMSEISGSPTEVSSVSFDIVCGYTYDSSGTPLVDGKFDSGGCQPPP